MSIVTVQLGQCGNQVGHELFDIICSDAQEGQRKVYSTASCERFFHQTSHGGKSPVLYKIVLFPVYTHTTVYLPYVFYKTDLVARAVLVDMEPKVIKQSISRAAKSGRWRYGETSHFSQKQGSGNNWANG